MRTRSASLSAWELGRPRTTGLPPYAPMATTTIILTPAHPMAFTDRSGSRVASSSAQVRGTTATTVAMDITAGAATTATGTGMGADLIAAIAVATGVAASAEVAVITEEVASMERAVSMAAGTAADAVRQAC